MIDEDRSAWTLGMLADEVIEACELPLGCRATIIAALGDAKNQGRAQMGEYAGELTALLRRFRDDVMPTMDALKYPRTMGLDDFLVSVNETLPDDQGEAPVGGSARGDANDSGPATLQPPTPTFPEIFPALSPAHYEQIKGDVLEFAARLCEKVEAECDATRAFATANGAGRCRDLIRSRIEGTLST